MHVFFLSNFVEYISHLSMFVALNGDDEQQKRMDTCLHCAICTISL